MKLKFLEKLDGLVIERPVDFSYHGVRVQFTALIDLVPTDKIAEITSGQGSSDAGTVRKLLTGWKHMKDPTAENDKATDVEFSPDTLDELLRYGGIAARLAIECVNAQYEVREKTK